MDEEVIKYYLYKNGERVMDSGFDKLDEAIECARENNCDEVEMAVWDMVEKWKAQEIVQYLEEQLSNSLLHDDLFEANENGYRCAINDIKEKYIDED